MTGNPSGGTRFDSILDTVGATPVIRISKLAPAGVDLYVKLEAFNPMGSVKDRLALGVIEHAEKTGELRPGQTVVEATSGNTGIGLAMVCARKGYPLVVTMAENFSVERRKLMRFLGARVVLTPAAEKGSGMLAKAMELAREHDWFLCRQFENEANADMHARTTAPEILAAFADRPLDYWVTGYGTGGTLKGVARVLKAQSPRTRIVVCEPDNSPLLGSGVRQVRRQDGSPAASHEAFRPHLMQGWTPDFISRLTEDAVDGALVDRVIPVNGQQSMELCHALARQEGIFTGISGGATFSGALALAREVDPGSSILCMLPDTGERYLSTPLFEDIPEEMTEEEISLSRSTPGYRFDVEAAGDPRVPEEEEEILDPEAVKLLDDLLSTPDKPVVLFALEWCEFCWSVRKLFARTGIDFHSVDLDSTAYQEGNRGGRIRAALRARTGVPTIPQIFVGDNFVGGCTELFDAWNNGQFQGLLRDHGVDWDLEVEINPYALLPAWLQPRKKS